MFALVNAPPESKILVIMTGQSPPILKGKVIPYATSNTMYECSAIGVGNKEGDIALEYELQGPKS